MSGIGRGAADLQVLCGLGGAPELVRWGDWGWVANMRLGYRHPRTGVRTTIDELVRVPDPEAWRLRRGPADVLCWGVLPNGRLRHPVWTRERSQGGAEDDCPPAT